MRILIIATLLLLTPNVCQAGEPDKDLHNKCIYPTVMIQGTKTGTGVIIKSVKLSKRDKCNYINYVFTCAHVLVKTPARIVESKEEKPKIVPAKYEYVIRVGVYEDWSLIKKIKTYPCEVIHVGITKDIALVSFVTDKKMPVADIDLNPKLYIGNEICRVGCGLGEPFRVDFGKVTSLSKSADRPIARTRNLYRTSIMTMPGDSGGPVYHQNKLIGLAQLIRSMSIPSGPFRTNMPVFHVSYVIPIKRFMDCKNIAKHIQKSAARPVAPPVPEEEPEETPPLPESRPPVVAARPPGEIQ